MQESISVFTADDLDLLAVLFSGDEVNIFDQFRPLFTLLVDRKDATDLVH